VCRKAPFMVVCGSVVCALWSTTLYMHWRAIGIEAGNEVTSSGDSTMCWLLVHIGPRAYLSVFVFVALAPTPSICPTSGAYSFDTPALAAWQGLATATLDQPDWDNYRLGFYCMSW
jgi:hypothetical protein